jgi:predicted nucleic acid-binding protein
VIVSPEVYNEVVVRGITSGAPDAVAAKFLFDHKRILVIGIISPRTLEQIASLPIDKGEVETIDLAVQENADLILVDNLHARVEARRAGLRIKGTLGVLVEAYRKGLVDFEELELLIEEIKSRRDIWISDELCEHVLREMQEELEQ